MLPEWRILKFNHKHFDLCHLHYDKYITINREHICSACNKKPTNEIILQWELLLSLVDTYYLGSTGYYDLDGRWKGTHIESVTKECITTVK